MKHILPALALIVCGSIVAAAETQKPNIIFIMADDLGYNELGCYGQKIIQTPHIDRLAQQGIRLTQHYSGSPVCASSRCVLMTGKHTGHSYVRTNREVTPKGRPESQLPIPAEEITIAEVLQAAGYATGAMGKWGLGNPDNTGDPNAQGFDLFFGYYGQRHAHNHYPRYLWKNKKRLDLEGNTRSLTGKHFSQDLMATEALGFIRENKDRPFFLYLPFIIPHVSIQVPEESLAQYKGKIPEVEYKVHSHYLKHPFPRAGYAAMVSHMDRDVGKIMSLLKELNLDDNTLVIFTSDNGPTYGRVGGSDSDFFHSAGPLRGLKGSVYEGGIRVPLVARWPGKIQPGRVSDHLSASWDVLPTLLKIASLEKQIPAGIDGISFASTLLDKGRQEQHDYLYWEFPSYQGQQAVRRGDWKAVRQKMFQGNMQIELYNLAGDIGEKNNVAEENPQLVKQFAEIMKQGRTASKEFPFKQLDEL